MSVATAQRGVISRHAKPLPRSVVRTANGVPQRLAGDTDEIARIAEQIRRCVEEGRVGLARAELSRLTPEQRSSKPLASWARALALPTAQLGSTTSTGSIQTDAAWLRAHARTYAGQWVALRNGVLVGHHEKQATLHQQLESQGQLDGVLFICLRAG